MWAITKVQHNIHNSFLEFTKKFKFLFGKRSFKGLIIKIKHNKYHQIFQKNQKKSGKKNTDNHAIFKNRRLIFSIFMFFILNKDMW